MNDTKVVKNEEDTIQDKNKDETESVKQDVKKEIRAFKKDLNRITGVILWQSGISFALGVNIVFLAIAYCILCFPDITSMLERYLEIAMGLTWSICILAAIVTVIFTYIYGRKKLGLHKIIITHKKMNLSSFVKILVCAVGISTLFSMIDLILEVNLNHFGLTLTNASGVFTELKTTIPGFLYIAFIAPVTEEIIYRGVLLRGLKKYGKVFAIVLSSIIFGCVHGNFSQGIFAACIGLIYGYVALEYSIKWTIFLHIFNNFILAMGMEVVISVLPEKFQTIITIGILALFTIAGVMILIRNKYKIKKYADENRTVKKRYKYAFQSACMIIIIASNLLMAVGMIMIPIVAVPKLEEMAYIEAYGNTEDYETMLKLTEEQLKKYPNSRLGMSKRAYLHILDEEYEEALVQYKQVLRQYDGDDEIYSNMSFAYNRLYNYELALYFAEKAIEYNDGYTFYDLYSNKADALKGLNRKEEAIEYYNKAIDEHPLSHPNYIVDDYASLAGIYSSTDQKPEALEIYKKILSIDPDNSIAFYEMLTIYKEQNKKEELLACGISYFKNITEDANYEYHVFAEDLYDLGFYKEAAEYYIKYAEIAEYKEDGYYGAAKCYLKLEDYEKAKSYYQKCVEIDPLYKKTAEEDGILEKLL